MGTGKIIQKRPNEEARIFELREQLGLNLDVQALRDWESYKNSLPLKALNKELREISTLQRHVEKLAKTWSVRAGWIWFLFWVLIIGGVIVFFNQLIPLAGLIFAASVPPLIVGILFSRKKKFYNSLNFKDSERNTFVRYTMLKALLDGLEKDNTKKKSLSLLLDFGKPEMPRKLLWEKEHPRHPERKVKRYQDPFLELKGRLVDGSVYRLRLRENFETIEWRNENNNSRRREKHKGYDIRLKLTPNPRCYSPRAELVGNAIPAVQLPTACYLKSMLWKNNQLIIRVKLAPRTEEKQREASFQPVGGIHQAVMMVLLSAYQILNLTHQQKRAA